MSFNSWGKHGIPFDWASHDFKSLSLYLLGNTHIYIDNFPEVNDI